MTVQARAPEVQAAPLDLTLAEQLARFLVQVGPAGVPRGVRGQAAWWVLDWFGCAVAGLATPPGAIVLRHTSDQPVGSASCLGLTDGRAPQVAALHNGAVSHIIEMDDVDRASVIHPGAVVIPAALAVAERVGASGRDLLGAIALGYEVAIRVGESVGKAHYFHWHNTATCGVFGAAAAAGSLLGLDQRAMTWALGSAGTQAGGLWEFIADGAMSKHLHAGRAAANGVLAAELAALGFTGARRILEGRQGFFAATAPDGDPSRVIEGLAAGWKLPGVSIKPFPSCRHTHSAVEAALRLRAEHGLGAADIQRVEIAGYRSMLDLADNPAPAHPYAAKFSVQYCVARALLDGSLDLAHFDDHRIGEPAVRDLMARTSVRFDPSLDARYPREFPAEVTVALRDGRRSSQSVGSPKGDPESPLTPEELADKFRALLGGSAYAARGEALITQVVGLEEAPTVRGLLAAPED